MKNPAASTAPDRGDKPIRDDGYSYLPRFITSVEAPAGCFGSGAVALMHGLPSKIGWQIEDLGREGFDEELDDIPN